MRKCIELDPADVALCRGAASFLQSDLWGRFKARFGWQALAFRVRWEGFPGQAAVSPDRADGAAVSPAETALLALHRPLGPGLSFAYVPWGPELPPDPEGRGWEGAARNEAAAAIAASLRRMLPAGTAFIRFDFPWYTEESPGVKGSSGEGVPGAAVPPQAAELSPRRPFLRAGADVQPPDSVLVNLLAGEEAVLGAMKPKWRYNVSLAEKKGVAVTPVLSSLGGASPQVLRAALDRFYVLYRETAARDGIAIHSPDYYRALFEEAAENGGAEVRLYLASHDGEDLAGIITLFRGREAVYLYGASSNRRRNLMAPYALQWRAMRDAQGAGCAYYDLFGIPPRPPEEAPDHPMAGLYRFKTGFIGGTGGTIIHRPGSWDYPCRPLVRAAYAAAEKTRKRIRDWIKKRKRSIP
ncbi:MAG: peptidoglycan bridge formation glycyltransferase FemA/FemB family protein [Treponema sp.]|jgi:lipid II:glycine glycyltransferase (peptidoglycan interpeptide bridge formation enzyme)|nr:peptidoglycan bridge formation glycyltransferase FemA/FemB family protein [Treponema sp.]